MIGIGEMILRIAAGGLFGALIGLERHLRAKEAGIRTHFLVGLGSALFMVISQFGFPDAERFDAARVAAQVVSGMGFLGAGLIIFHKNSVRGLTTAAGIWVVSAIGLASGSGMFEVALVCEIVVLICLELLNYYTVRLGDKEFTAVLTSSDQNALTGAATAFKKSLKAFSLSKQEGGYKAEMVLHFPKRETTARILERLNSCPGAELESFE